MQHLFSRIFRPRNQRPDTAPAAALPRELRPATGAAHGGLCDHYWIAAGKRFGNHVALASVPAAFRAGKIIVIAWLLLHRSGSRAGVGKMLDAVGVCAHLPPRFRNRAESLRLIPPLRPCPIPGYSVAAAPGFGVTQITRWLTRRTLMNL